jgi:adenosylmethionine-8-amino-7-oxononanoate aminotransferase
MKEILSFKKLNLKAEQVVKAKSYQLYLKNGQILNDTMSGLWCVPLGYSNKDIKNEMINQLNTLPYGTNFLGRQNEITETYAEQICKVTNMDRVYFTNSGSTAVETAIKITKRKKAIVSKRSYHGSTILSACASDQKINDSWNLNNPIDVLKFNNAEDLEDILRKNTDAFVLLEPVIAAGGVYEQPKEVFEVCKKYQQKNVPLLLDETVTGFGKIGTLFAFEKYNLEPDVLILGKSITNGYFPMGACLTKNHMLDNIKFFNHGFTYSGHPIGCAVALKVLQILSNTSLFNHKKFLKNKNITRQVGCMGAIDFESSKKSLKFLKDMLNEGYILEYGSENLNTIVYCLPYIMNETEYNNFLNTVEKNLYDNRKP